MALMGMTCPKCGTEEELPGSWYDRQQQAGRISTVPARPVRRTYCWRAADCQAFSPLPPGVPDEHLDVTCGGCGYTMAEKCKDAK